MKQNLTVDFNAFNQASHLFVLMVGRLSSKAIQQGV